MDRQALQQVLGRIESFAAPDPELEQYQTPPDIAANVLWTVYMADDLGELVIDLGCGTGIFAIGAAVLGVEAAGFDADPDAIETARKNAEMAAGMVGRELDVAFHVADVTDVEVSADCVVMNPPFGVQDRDANLPFIRKAVEIAPVTYALLLRAREADETRSFVKDEVSAVGGAASVLGTFRFPVPRQFSFHEREEETVMVDLYKFERGSP